MYLILTQYGTGDKLRLNMAVAQSYSLDSSGSTIVCFQDSYYRVKETPDEIDRLFVTQPSRWRRNSPRRCKRSSSTGDA